MDCPGCGTTLHRFVRDTLLPGETSTNFVVQVTDDTIPETEALFFKEGFWAASSADAETFTYARDLPTHSILSAEGQQIVGGTHQAVRI